MSRPTIAHLRDGTAVAGWLCKANPEVWDAEGHLASHGSFDRWRLMHGYRADLVGPGHPMVIWLTGSRAGVIAVGHVTGTPELAHDERTRTLRPYVAIDCAAVVPPLRKREVLRDLAFSRAEVIRTPRSANPLALTADHLDAIADLLPIDPWAPE